MIDSELEVLMVRLVAAWSARDVDKTLKIAEEMLQRIDELKA